MESKIHKKIIMFANLSSTTLRTTNIRSTFIFKGTWISITWPLTQWERYTSEWCGQVTLNFVKIINSYIILTIFSARRLSGLENGLLGLNSRVNAVNWSKTDSDNIDVICFGHLLFEMCAGYELGVPQPSPAHLELELDRYPQVADILSFIFDSPDGKYPTIEDLVICDLFRNIDLREMRGTCIPV